ncbi:hypothetical protein [Candidatus Electronema sp. JC]
MPDLSQIEPEAGRTELHLQQIELDLLQMRLNPLRITSHLLRSKP